MLSWTLWQPDRGDDRPGPFTNLTVEELMRLARWASAYHVEAVHGAGDGKRWVFARYLRTTRRLNEEF